MGWKIPPSSFSFLGTCKSLECFMRNSLVPKRPGHLQWPVSGRKLPALDSLVDFHHRCSRWAMDTSHRSNFLKASRLPKILDTFIPAGPQRHSRRVRGHARPILVCTGVLSQLTVKQGHLLTHPLPFHPKRKKNILDNSGLNPGINSHTDYKSHRGKIHKIVSKSKNRSRLRVSTLVTEHAGISILKGKRNKKNLFWINFEWTTNPGKPHANPWQVKKKKNIKKNSSIPKSQLSQGQTKGNMELWVCCIINAREQRLCWNSTWLWTD